MGQQLAVPTIVANNMNVTMAWHAFVLTLGQQQPVVNERNEVIGTAPMWTAAAQLSPQAAVQLHAILGETIGDYERAFGKIPRMAVMFTKFGAVPPAEGQTGVVMTMDGKVADPGGIEPPPVPPMAQVCPACRVEDGAHERWCPNSW